MLSAQLVEAQRLVETGRFPTARVAARGLLAKRPELAEVWMLLALTEQRLQDHEAMLVAARHAARLQPESMQVMQKLAEALLLCGFGAEARALLRKLEARAQQDERALTVVAGLYDAAGAHLDRLRCARQALTLAPASLPLLASLAAAETACGELESAEQHLDRLLEVNPHDYGSYYRRSILRTQTSARNHVAELRQLAQWLPADSPHAIPLCYALAKEYEDLGQYDDAFAQLQRGASRRRRSLSYQVADDEAVMRAIAEVFSAERLAAVGTVGQQDPTPIFVTGLPRSGTTLVDRILSSHSSVQSLGEINDLSHAISALALGVEQDRRAPPDRLELVRRTAGLDYSALGHEYLRRIGGYPQQAAHLIDKTPWNFLYIGIIALALPRARIIHVRRNPMDSCFALYKTLFRAGSPYSYDLDDLARYYLAYHRLMRHWRRLLPGRLIEIEYEQLVRSQHAETARLLDRCGLGFEPRCLDFHRNSAPAATASAAQVREPLHARSVECWKRHAAQLAPLARALRAGGLAIDGL